MLLYTAAQSKQLDQWSEEAGVSTQILMANAGRKIARIILEQTKPKEGPVVCLIGKGNNGGDGLVAAKHLLEKKYSVTLIRNAEELKQQAIVLKQASWIIDGLLGVGLQGEVRGWMRDAIHTVNALHKKVLAIDIPSGLSADSGLPLGCAIQSTITACLGGVKLGCVLYPGCDFAGDIRNIDIGIPKTIYPKLKTPYHLIEVEDFKSELKPRRKDSHKKDFGHVLIIAGSLGMPGAGFLAASGALRSGAGVVTLALPERAFEKFEPRYAEVMTSSIPDEGKGYFTSKSIESVLKQCEGKQGVVLGPGLGSAQETITFVKQILEKIEPPLVLDADGLNAVALQNRLLTKRRKPTIITPHPGEMGKLLGRSTKEIQEDRVTAVLEAVKRWKLCAILKGYRTLVATQEGDLYVNPTGNPGMATAGMGDVLAGVIAGLLAQGFSQEKAALAGVFLHGMAGDMVAEEKGEKGLLAGDVSTYIPKALHLVENLR